MHKANCAGGAQGRKDQAISSRRLGQTWGTLKEPKPRLTLPRSARSSGLRLTISSRDTPSCVLPIKFPPHMLILYPAQLRSIMTLNIVRPKQVPRTLHTKFLTHPGYMRLLHVSLINFPYT